MIGEAVPRDALSNSNLSAMYGLLDRYFSGVSHDVFESDLEEKNWIILLRDQNGLLQGFSTLMLYSTVVQGEVLRVVYSGDTIVDRSAWGSFALPKAWIQAVWSLHPPDSAERLLWLLITSGFRTYRFLPVFWRDFYPHYKRSADRNIERFVRELAIERFGPGYDPKTGLVTLSRPQALRGDLAEIPEGKRKNPHVEFFAQRNPGWSGGDELVCLAELSRANLTRAGRRMLTPNTPAETLEGAA